MNKIETKAFVQEKFAEYYRHNAAFVEPPTSLSSREFAFLVFKERMMLRHRGFSNVEDLRTQLQMLAPSDVYYSSAYYEKPEEEMEAKGWLGADLVFDIDADHIPTPCEKQHDTWSCNNCGATGRGAPPEKCPTCKGQKIEDKSWPCEICLESAKRETVKLVDVLTRDFGLSLQEMILAFSGHRGYHVHVENETVQTFDQMARKEIVDYLLGIGFEPKFHGLEEEKGPRLEQAGWGGRVARGTYEILLNSTAVQLEQIGLKKNVAHSVHNQKDNILESWKSKGPWKTRGIGAESWKLIVQKAVENESVKIDTVVTTDIHRLIRLANTVHGKTGLKKVLVSASDIERFDPFKDAVAFSHGTVNLFAFEAPEFKISDKRYGPFKNEKVELPTAAALFLLCKGAAKVTEETSHV